MCVHNNHLTCLSLASKWTKGFFAGHRAICRGDVCDHGCLNVGCWSFLGAKMKMFTNIWIKVHVFTLLKSCNVWDSPLLLWWPWSEISLEYVPIHPDRPKKKLGSTHLLRTGASNYQDFCFIQSQVNHPTNMIENVPPWPFSILKQESHGKPMKAPWFLGKTLWFPRS